MTEDRLIQVGRVRGEYQGAQYCSYNCAIDPEKIRSPLEDFTMFDSGKCIPGTLKEINRTQVFRSSLLIRRAFLVLNPLVAREFLLTV